MRKVFQSRRFLPLSVAFLLSLALFAERQPYSRYQTIVDRQMFGLPPVGFDPTKPPSEVSRMDSRAEQEVAKEKEKLKSSIHFSVINLTPEGDTAVGFTDKSNPKELHHYYLKVGESRDGWLVKEADAAARTMTIVKGELEVALALGGDSSKGAGTTSDRSDLANVPMPLKAEAETAPHSRLLGRARMGSLRERRLAREQRLQTEEKRLADEKKRFDEEKAQREAQEQAQREQDRAEMQEQFLKFREEIRRNRLEKADAAAESAQDAPSEHAEVPPEESAQAVE